MNVTITCHLSARRPGTVYAKMEDSAQDVMVSATLDYCLSAAKERGYNITNAQDVLMWLHMNSSFVGYPTNSDS